MESAIGALGSPDDVFNQRYQDFFDNLLTDSSSLGFAILASFVDRLTTEMFRIVQQKIQTKLVDASRLEHSEGIAFFAWSVLRKHPKILAYNQGAYRLITWKALEFAFLQRFIKDDAVEDDSIFEVPFALFSTIYASDWKLITRSITVVSKKQPPYNQDSILDISILNEYGNTKKSCLLYFLWSLLENVVVNAAKGYKVNIEYVLKVFEISVSLKRKMVTQKAFETIITIAQAVKTNFAIYVDRILYILQTLTIPSSIAYKFLISLLQELGPLADISSVYTTAVFKFANAIDKSGTQDASQNLSIIGRQEFSNEVLSKIQNDENDEEDDIDSLFDLVICVLETIPTFIPVPFIKNIEIAICNRLLKSQNPTAKDLQLLNALLAIRNAKIPSPIQIARIVYSWSSVYKNPELAPYIKIGKALCDTQRSARMNIFELFEVKEVKANGIVEKKFMATVSDDNKQSVRMNTSLKGEKPRSNGTVEKNVTATISDDSERSVRGNTFSLLKEKSQSNDTIEKNETATASDDSDRSVDGEKPRSIDTVEEDVTVSDDSEQSDILLEGEKPQSNDIVQKKVTATVPDDSDDDCMIIDEINPSKSTTPSSSSTPGNRKRKNLKTENATPPSKKMNTDESKRSTLTVPDMIKDLFVQ